MKLNGLAVIGIIILIPIILMIELSLSSVRTSLKLQSQYDAYLLQATSDALTSMRLNSDLNPGANLSNSQILDIEASINTFYLSMKNLFNQNGYSKNEINAYIPAILYSGYQGFYIYTNYKNEVLEVTDENNTSYTLGEKTDDLSYSYDPNLDDIKVVKGIDDQDLENDLYSNSDKLSGLKPYTSYMQRYVGDKYDVYINYSLDTYISILVLDKETKQMYRESGYIFGDTLKETNGVYEYNGFTIESEEPIEYITYAPNTEEQIYKALRESSSDLSTVGLDTYYYTSHIENINNYLNNIQLNDGETLPESLDLYAAGINYDNTADTSDLMDNFSETDVIHKVFGKVIKTGTKEKYKAIKINGRLYYWINDELYTYSSENKALKNPTSTMQKNYDENGEIKLVETKNTAALKFCSEAINFRNKILNDPSNPICEALTQIQISDAVDNQGKKLSGSNLDTTLYEMLNQSPEEPTSIFESERQSTIKRIIEQSLNNAIVNYQVLNVGTNQTAVENNSNIKYQMPKISATDWDKIVKNVCMTTFLQGLDLGTKTYNGYATLANNSTREYVSPTSIKLAENVIMNESLSLTNPGYYHDFREEHLYTDTGINSISYMYYTAVHSVDLDKHVFDRQFTVSIYDDKDAAESDTMGTLSTYSSNQKLGQLVQDISATMYQRPEYKCYNDNYITFDKRSSSMEDFWNQLKEKYSTNPEIQGVVNALGSKYYTGLFREKYGMFRIENEILTINHN